MEEPTNPVAEEDSRAEWIPPAVEDFDVEALTMSGPKDPSGHWDLTSYS